MVTAASRFLRYIPEDPMRGPDVRGVQERLRTLGFYAGPLDGIYGRATFDAVVAFQAVRRIDPDGIVGPTTYSTLGSGPTPPGIGERGPMIHIDLEQSRLFLNEGGTVRRIYNVAVGSPATPTPVGRWVIVEKALEPGGPFGTRWMRINVPWGGYGIHGTDQPESIGQAVSHGCVRMFNRDVEELYPRVPIGTMVNIVGQVFTGRVLIPGQSTGPDVRAVQDLLRVLGFFTGISDGVFGPETADAVRRFQTAQRLVADGIVGPMTYDALLKVFSVQRGLRAP